MASLIASLDDLARDPAKAAALSVEERGRLIVLAAAVLAALGAALTLPAEPPQPEPPDRLLTAEEAAPIAGLTVKQLKTRRLPFRKKLGHRSIRYSARGIERWLARLRG
jgi:predicted DNA-binding transcriptional regulator AlpA